MRLDHAGGRPFHLRLPCSVFPGELKFSRGKESLKIFPINHIRFVELLLGPFAPRVWIGVRPWRKGGLLALLLFLRLGENRKRVKAQKRRRGKS